MHLFAAEQIVKALVAHGTSEKEQRTLEERYNIIVEAIYGENADEHLLKNPSHRPRINTIEHHDYILLQMYEMSQKDEDLTQKDLAEMFVDEINFKGTRRNAVDRLTTKYRNKLPELKNPEEQELIKFFARIHGDQHGYDGFLHEEMEVIKKLLIDNGWCVLKLSDWKE